MTTRWVGQAMRRVEDPALVTGRGAFVADLNATLSIHFVRSPVARGRIRSIEIPQGVTAFTADDLEGVGRISPVLNRPDYVRVEQPLLADGEVNFMGEPVVVVVAPSREEAEDAAEQVFLDIDSLPAVVDLEQPRGPVPGMGRDGAPGTVVVEGKITTGDVATAFEEATEVVEVRIRSHRQNALPLEARGAHVSIDPVDGRVTLTASTQMPHLVRTAVADLLGLAESRLRVIAPNVGGGFGQKMSLAPEYVVAVWVALRMNSSVSWVEDRRENFTSSFHARDQAYLVRAAFDAEARLMAIDADLSCNVGAYACYPVTFGVEPLMALAELPGPYDFQSYSAVARGVTTNTCPMAPYRGVSRPVLTLAMERIMDLAGERFGIGPVEVRRRNLIQEFPYRSATGILYDEGSYVASLEAAAKAIDVDAFRSRQEEARGQGRYLGIGFSVFSERTGYGTPAFAARGMGITPGYEMADVSMDPSGSVEVRIGASPHGQGLKTSLSQLVADELGVEPGRVTIVTGDTDRTPYGWGTFASRSMVMAGGAALLGVQELRAKLARIAGELLEASHLDIVFEQGRAGVRGTDQGMPITQLARAAYHSAHLLGDLDPGLSAHTVYDPAGTFSNACHVAMVEVDPETGGVRIERFLVVEDAGRLVNPMIVDGQIAGGVVQGMANALLEELVYDELGNLLTASLLDYLPPTCSEVPEIEILHLETITAASVTGAKGLGEGGTIGAPAAVINAISDALRPLGVEVFDIPATPQRVRDLMREVQTT